MYDVDDALWRRDSFVDHDRLSRRVYRRFLNNLAAADTILAGNHFLRDWIAQHVDPINIRLIPTCVNTAAYTPRFEPDEKESDQPFTLAWIGSASTMQALEQRADLFEHLGRTCEPVRLRVIADACPRFDRLDTEAVAWSPTTEADALAGADVGVSWLPDDDWSRGKCGLKILQYMAAGLPVIANPVGVHPEMIEHERSGFLASTADEWTDAVRTLERDPDRRVAMGRRAREIVEARYDVRQWIGVFERALTGASPAMKATA